MNIPITQQQLTGLELVKWLDNVCSMFGWLAEISSEYFMFKKLGDLNNLWSGKHASTLLSRQMLTELTSCFQALEPHVKLKIVEAIPYLPTKMIQMVRF